MVILVFFEILVNGVVTSSISVDRDSIDTTLFLSYEGSTPNSVSFKFNGYDDEEGRFVRFSSVSINGVPVSEGSLTQYVLYQGEESYLDVSAESESFGVNISLPTSRIESYIYGDIADDVIEATTKNDKVFGNAGNDSIYGAEGKDKLIGGSGSDLLYGGGDNDKILGGDGNDTLHGEEGNDKLLGEAGMDTMFGGLGNDKLVGGDGDDNLFGDDGFDNLVGGFGEDYLNGGSGNDKLVGDNGDDLLDGSGGHDRLFGGAGNDMLYGGSGNDKLTGGEGHDLLDGGIGKNKFYGGLGNDLLYANDEGTDIFIYSNLVEVIANIDTIYNFDTSGVDKIDLRGLLPFDKETDEIRDFVILTDLGSGMLLSIDIDGIYAPDEDGYQASMPPIDVAMLDGVTGVQLDTLVANESILAG